MIVADAGVVIELLIGGLDPLVLGTEEIAVPHLLDSEVISVLRRLVRTDRLAEAQGAAAVDGFADLSLTRFPAAPLRPRMWELRHNLTGYDATYVALAEAVGASSLLTTDRRLANASGPRCRIVML